MLDNSEMILDHLKELRRDHQEVNKNLAKFEGKLVAQVENLSKEIKELKDDDKELHNRIDKKDDRIRDLEKRQHDDEQSFTRLETRIETTNKTNRLWIFASAAATTAIATAAAVIIAIIL